MKNLFKWLLVIGMIVTPLAFSKAEGEKERSKTSFGSESIEFYPAPAIISFNIEPNPAEWGQTAIPRYRIVPEDDLSLKVFYYLDGKPYDLVSLMKILNNNIYDGGYGCTVSLVVTSYSGTAQKDVKFYRKPKSVY